MVTVEAPHGDGPKRAPKKSWIDELAQIVLDEGAHHGMTSEELISLAAQQFGKKVSALAALSADELQRLYESLKHRR